MPAPADDRRHALLSRAHRGRQAELGFFAPAPSRQERRRIDPNVGFEVNEVEVRSALTKCALPGEPWSLNPYMGCSHDCVYCYVPDVAHLDRSRYGSYVLVKRNLPTVLAKELKTKERRPVFLSSATDPYQPAEGIYEITRRSLEQLLRVDWPLRVLTRNPLVTRDMDLFHRFNDFEVGMSVPTFDDAARRIIEPGAPPIQGRLAALRTLADDGFEPFVNIMPAYPFTGGIGPREIAAALKAAGVAEVIAGPWRYMDGVLPALQRRIEGSPVQHFEEAVLQEDYYARMFRALDAAFRREGIPFRSMWTPERRTAASRPRREEPLPVG